MKYFGRSLVPVLEEPDKEQREFVCCEGGRLQGEIYADEFHSLKNIGKSDLYWPRLSAQTDDVAHGKATMLRTRYYKYICGTVASFITLLEKFDLYMFIPHFRHRLVYT